jgi:pimeloyl-ACP methyl ester carboxylesterase
MGKAVGCGGRYRRRRGDSDAEQRVGPVPVQRGGRPGDREHAGQHRQADDRGGQHRTEYQQRQHEYRPRQAHDLLASVPELRVPVFFVEGRHDHECPAEVAERYFQWLSAPAKELIWLERSAHLPNSEVRDRFNTFMIDRILPIAKGSAPGTVAAGYGVTYLP